MKGDFASISAFKSVSIGGGSTGFIVVVCCEVWMGDMLYTTCLASTCMFIGVPNCECVCKCKITCGQFFLFCFVFFWEKGK